MKRFKELLKENNKSSVIVYFTLRFLVILCLVRELGLKNYNNALLCLLSLCLLLVPFFLERKFKIEIPNALEIFIYIFIFSAEILGEINNFYLKIPAWDSILHTLNGFLAAAVGFSLFNLLNEHSEKIDLSPWFLCMVSFCFSMTIGAMWEMFEYNMDRTLSLDMQKDTIVNRVVSVDENNVPVIMDNINKTILYSGDKEIIYNGHLDIGLNDTMHDLNVNFIGAFIFNIFGFLYLKKDKYKFIKGFMPTRRE